MSLTIEFPYITVGGDTPYRIDTFEGWYGTPGASFEDVPASDRHGVAETPAVLPARYFTVGGFMIARDEAQRQALRRSLMAALIPADPNEARVWQIRVIRAGVTRKGYGQIAYTSTPEDFRGGAVQRWAVQVRMPDPRAFGPVVTREAPLLVNTVGRKLPFTLPSSLPQKPIGGQVVIENPGNTTSPVAVFLLGGQSSPGVAVLSTGRRVQYQFPLQDGDVLTVDSRSGSELNGQRRPTWLAGSDAVALLALPPGTSVVQATGKATSGNARIIVQIEPAYWE